MHTLDMPRTIALLKPLTAMSEIALRLVGINDAEDARIIAKNILKPGEYFIPLWVKRYVAALPRSHPLTLKDKLCSSDLAGAAMIDRCHCEQSEFFGRAASSQRNLQQRSRNRRIGRWRGSPPVSVLPSFRKAWRAPIRMSSSARSTSLQCHAVTVRSAAEIHRAAAASAAQSRSRKDNGQSEALALHRHGAPDHGLGCERRIGGLCREFADQAVGIGRNIVRGLDHQPFQRPAIGRDPPL